MKRSLSALAAVLAVLTALVVPGDAAPTASAPKNTKPALDTTSVVVQLAGDPLTVNAKTRPAGSRKVDFNSTAFRSERANLSAVRNDFRAWLRANAAGARVTSETDISLHSVSVTLNGTSLATLRSAPNVLRVEYQGVYRAAAHDDPDLSLINTQAAWNRVGGDANAGAGVKVAVVDSGIDASHPCFDDAGYPNSPQQGDPAFTNNKVIVAKVFHNKARKNAYTAEAIDSHGTHVAGTIACNAHTPAVIDGVEIPYDPSGVAPAAQLGNYNVFPGDSGEARSEDILNALDAAYADGFDVANMSLGGARNDGGGAFLLDNAINNLDRANMVVAVAAGNEGPGYYTVHYPGAAPRALTAGASTVGHSIVNLLTVAGADYEFVTGDFADIDEDLTAPLKVVADPNSAFDHGLDLGCDGGAPLPDLTGTIAMLGRGDCDFTVKMRNAQNAGAVGVIVVDRVEEPPFLMSHNGLEAQPTIPGVMVRLSDGAKVDDHDGEPVTLHALGVYTQTPEDTNLMASFSSWGPTHGDLLIKPDVVAPGADIVSAFPASTCDEPPCWSFLGGTSMATPHIAGVAAVVRGFNPDWTAAQVRSAVTNTAQQNLLRETDTGDVTNDPLITGAGLADTAAAVEAVAALDPVSQSFGQIASGSSNTRTATLTLTNISDASRTYTVTVADLVAADGVTFSGGAASITLAPGASKSFTVTVASTKGAADGNRYGQVNVSTGGVEVAHAAVFMLVGEADHAPGQHQLPPPKA
jgi:minor extracellular serine protease Vpr